MALSPGGREENCCARLRPPKKSDRVHEETIIECAVRQHTGEGVYCFDAGDMRARAACLEHTGKDEADANHSLDLLPNLEIIDHISHLPGEKQHWHSATQHHEGQINDVVPVIAVTCITARRRVAKKGVAWAVNWSRFVR